MIKLKPILSEVDQDQFREIINNKAIKEPVPIVLKNVERLMQSSFDMGVQIGLTAHRFKDSQGFYLKDE